MASRPSRAGKPLPMPILHPPVIISELELEAEKGKEKKKVSRSLFPLQVLHREFDPWFLN